MPNNYFQFKQFKIYQDKCAMKVCTDACLFGAWAAEQMQDEKLKITNILDIGTGTGLLSLMLAQKLSAPINAVEIDEQAALQAKDNFEASPWKERLAVFNTPIQQFNSTITYDLIICNPPFFKQSLRSSNHQKNVAKHSISLFLNELNNIILRLLKPKGRFAILLPYTEFRRFEIAAKQEQLNLEHKANIQQMHEHSFFRTIGIFSKQPTPEAIYETLSIRDVQNCYAPRFTELLKDYYLHL